MTDKPNSSLNALAAEALDLWQEHLATLAADPKAKAQLADLLEPSRRLFAEWTEKAQAAAHDAPTGSRPTTTAAVRPAAAGVASDDGLVRLAQLALHVADLEKRLARLESRPAAKIANAHRRRPSS